MCEIGISSIDERNETMFHYCFSSAVASHNKISAKFNIVKYQI